MTPEQALRAIAYMYPEELMALARRLAEAGEWQVAITLQQEATFRLDALIAPQELASHRRELFERH